MEAETDELWEEFNATSADTYCAHDWEDHGVIINIELERCSQCGLVRATLDE